MDPLSRPPSALRLWGKRALKGVVAGAALVVLLHEHEHALLRGRRGRGQEHGREREQGAVVHRARF
ncbi:hypothetical protein L6R46_09105, partial [Myxococcota bacterium]|nr:hypothetical protein [Myxococcota bacterium]